MFRFVAEAGPLIFPIVLLAVVIAMLVLWNLVSLVAGFGSARIRRHSIDSILFWGGLAALLGFLGQWVGIYKMIQVIAARGIVNPQAVTYGLSESLLTPLAGMTVMVIAAFVWFFLRIGLWTTKRGSL